MMNFVITGVMASALGGVLPQYQAVLDRAVSLGYSIPSGSASAAWNDFLRKRIADGSYAKMDVMWNIAWNDAGLSDFSRLNHISPANHTFTYQNSPTYQTSGIKGNASNAYVDTNFNPSTSGVNYQQNSASRGMWVYTGAVTGNALDGVSGSPNNRFAGANTQALRINQSTGMNSAVNAGGTGYKGIDAPDSTNRNVFIGTTKNARTATGAAIHNGNQLLLRADTGYSDAVMSFYFMGGSLTDTQHNNIANDYQTFLTAIGL